MSQRISRWILRNLWDGTPGKIFRVPLKNITEETPIQSRKGSWDESWKTFRTKFPKKPRINPKANFWLVSETNPTKIFRTKCVSLDCGTPCVYYLFMFPKVQQMCCLHSPFGSLLLVLVLRFLIISVQSHHLLRQRTNSNNEYVHTYQLCIEANSHNSKPNQKSSRLVWTSTVSAPTVTNDSPAASVCNKFQVETYFIEPQPTRPSQPKPDPCENFTGAISQLPPPPPADSKPTDAARLLKFY